MSVRLPYLQHGRRHGRRGSDPIDGLLGRTVWGQIDNSTTSGPNSDGILDPGSGGWTVSGDDGGHWTVTFDTPFTSRPTIQVCGNDSTTSPPAHVSLTLVDAAGGYFEVTTYYPDGSDLTNDVGFNFIATGA